MTREELERTYHLFFTSGGYKAAKLLVLKAEKPFEKTSDDYDLLSILMWKDDEGSKGERIINKIHEKLQHDLADIIRFMFALYDAMLLIPLDRAEALNTRFGRDTKPREDGISSAKMIRQVFPSLYKVLFSEGPINYDFSTEGVAAIERINRIVDMARTSALSRLEGEEDILFPIENAMEAARIFKKPEFQVYSGSVQEMLLQDEEDDGIPSVLTVKTKRIGNQIQIYSDSMNSKYVERYIYQLYGDGRFLSAGLYPLFVEPAKKIKALKDPDSLKIFAKPKGFLGEEYDPDEASIGSLSKFSLQSFPQVCDYVLLKDGVEIAKKKEPMFIVQNRDPKAKYTVKLVKNNERVDDMLSIKREVSALPKRTALERKTATQESTALLEQMYDVLLSMELLRHYLPHKFRGIMKYRDTGNEKRRIDTFWELSCLLVDCSAIK